MNFPQSKRFAFTILDDTDDSTLENVKPVYDALRVRGIRTTKTVWPVDCPEGSRIFFAADTLQRKPYLEFVRQLRVDGFEIAFHGATMESSRRDRTVQALDFLKAEFGAYPTLFCNHGQNRDNLYWGYKRFQTSWLRRMVGLLRKEAASYYLGDVKDTDYFWGDLCREHQRSVPEHARGQSGNALPAFRHAVRELVVFHRGCARCRRFRSIAHSGKP